jgi:hypothetical protein
MKRSYFLFFYSKEKKTKAGEVDLKKLKKNELNEKFVILKQFYYDI